MENFHLLVIWISGIISTGKVILCFFKLLVIFWFKTFLLEYSYFTMLHYFLGSAKQISYMYTYILFFGFPSHLDHHRTLNRVPLRRQWHPTPVLLPGKSHGWRRLVGCSPWGRWGSDTTEWLHFSLSCIGEGNGNPLQCSCLENPRDGGAWWAAVSGVAQSRTWLKWLSSSSSSYTIGYH